ncbi:MAG TPA: hypothetical protein PKM43_20030 [Verrucomicrobiota bacterium]|nr:hypothetical protein [Verrucomicrobiota bacterium]HRZ57576.1 hypothetical protein [Candidatus Paceibacterota bacterium]
MSEILVRTALAYASRHRLGLSERLGFGIHAIVFVAEGNFKPGHPGETAVKVDEAADHRGQNGGRAFSD